MNEIFKVVGDFQDNTFTKIINKLEENFSFIYLDNTMYVALNHINTFDDNEKELRKIFKPSKNYYIQSITSSDLQSLNDWAKDWCVSNINKLALQRKEVENQEILKARMDALDKTEVQLIELMNKKRKEES